MKKENISLILVLVVLFSFPFVNAEYPESMSWRDRHGHSWVSEHLVSQGVFGTCWAFSSIAALESQYMTAFCRPDDDIDLAELHLLTCCEDCWNGPSQCRIDGGNPYYAITQFLTSNNIAKETSYCYPYSDLSGTPNDCFFPSCSEDNYCSKISVAQKFVFEDSTINSLEMIKNGLFIYGALGGTFDYTGEDHSMLIYGYNENNELLVKDSGSDPAQFRTENNMPKRIFAPLYVPPSSAIDCQNEDGDAYCWWSIAAFHSGVEKPNSCNGLGCGRNVPDADDSLFCESIWPTGESNGGCGLEIMCGDGTCQSWEACFMGEANGGCFNDCYRPGGRDGYACCGNGIYEDGEDCSWCPQDVEGGCPECSDGIDNDGDGFIDFMGYLNYDKDVDCTDFYDNNETRFKFEEEPNFIFFKP
tara:strand:+ start:1193 stop:2440 length:1248 start_codon:yes stop_codon:yes gene_type:complete